MESKDSRICPDCNLRRTQAEFFIGAVEFKNCCNCHAKYGRRVLKGSKPAKQSIKKPEGDHSG